LYIRGNASGCYIVSFIAISNEVARIQLNPVPENLTYFDFWTHTTPLCQLIYFFSCSFLNSSSVHCIYIDIERSIHSGSRSANKCWHSYRKKALSFYLSIYFHSTPFGSTLIYCLSLLFHYISASVRGEHGAGISFFMYRYKLTK